MSFANERDHLKIVIWRVLDSCGFIFYRAKGPAAAGITAQALHRAAGINLKLTRCSSRAYCENNCVRLTLTVLSASESESVNGLLWRARAQVTVTVTVLVVRQPECLNMMPLELELITVQWSAWVQGHKVTAPRQHGRCAAEPAGDGPNALLYV